ncbi:hypothetical protein E1B28_011642 [Marasmius oreades]|uniref:Uncharacterized protein n=1 Tax=Marasmius oreades TaxID=181124 RepID=A0A9P7RVL2_9AGAR|nr:uncharacterized protein E1B28_011642 [Marasmius oreades]KAG7090021.1 hypothetical protein E1B28_011642 [Marasmius oreades]
MLECRGLIWNLCKRNIQDWLLRREKFLAHAGGGNDPIARDVETVHGFVGKPRNGSYILHPSHLRLPGISETASVFAGIEVTREPIPAVLVIYVPPPLSF